MSKESILKEFELFSFGGEGIGGWLSKDTNEEVFQRLDNISKQPLSKVQLNQLFVLGHQAPISDDFYHYYWFENPSSHPYPVNKLPGFQETWAKAKTIESLVHLKWGLYRLFIDGLLYFGDLRFAFRKLRSMSNTQLTDFFSKKSFDTLKIKERGPSLSLKEIIKDDRYLISEMACKSFGSHPETPGEMQNVLSQAYRDHLGAGGGPITYRELITGQQVSKKFADRQTEFTYSAEAVLDESISSEQEINEKLGLIVKKFFKAREAALMNTSYYLSMVSDLDVYVATSMRNRKDFRDMANFCDDVFSNKQLADLQLRYFDPTLSAAAGHEDKGLIECLMVKCAKVLVYCAGEKESYGKDAEAAMALSLGKPVIFYCGHEQRSRFYRDVHPLSRLIEFQSGIAVGAMVTDSIDDVQNLLYRLFENKMEYQLEQPKPGYLRLKEVLTESVVRLQTSDRLLRDTFWNHYHS